MSDTGTRELSGAALASHLGRLAEDLEQFPSSVDCPAAVARIFNELVAATKRSHADDPVVSAVAPIARSGVDSSVSTELVGTVRTLVGQLIVCVEQN